MLEDELKIEVAIYKRNMFMQDGAPVIVQRVISLSRRISKRNWPGNSPDLNPIENLWALKHKVADEHPTSAKGLEMAIKCI